MDLQRNQKNLRGNAIILVENDGGISMNSTDSLQLFEDQPIRTAWDGETEEWYFSIVDVVGVLTDRPDARHAANIGAFLRCV